MSMTRDTVLFDLDGTLLDTLADLADATNYALREMSFPERTLDEVRAFVGNGVYHQIGHAVPAGTSDEDIARTIDIYRPYYAAHASIKTALYDGIPALLDALSARGCPMAVISNKFDAAVKDLQGVYFSRWIPKDLCIGEMLPARRKKPAPDSVFDAMKLLGVQPERCVYVGDSEVDFETAKNAALPFIGCAWGFRGEALLRSLGAEYIIRTPAELPKVLTAISENP